MENATAPEAGDSAQLTARRPVWWLVERLHRVVPNATPRLVHAGTRTGYGLVNRYFRSTPFTCLNYGWATLEGDGLTADTHLSSEQRGAGDRFGLQMYERVAFPHVSDKDVLEVGSGRGGGAVFLHQALGAKSVTGVDLTPTSVSWCKQHWSEPGVQFAVGDAESLTFADGSFDAVVNVESSHNYPHVESFFAEVCRVLRPGGVLLFADFRPADGMAALAQTVTDAGLVIEENEDISANVVRALTMTSAEHEAGIDTNFPSFLRKRAKEFAATQGSAAYQRLATKEFEYRRIVARKPS